FFAPGFFALGFFASGLSAPARWGTDSFGVGFSWAGEGVARPAVRSARRRAVGRLLMERKRETGGAEAARRGNGRGSKQRSPFPGLDWRTAIRFCSKGDGNQYSRSFLMPGSGMG